MAYVLSSVSGNLISAASAGFAPTNSADVSAIASSYQVVSATATQLYAGTAFVTEINGSPLSASRAGNAANASMANSAYYDGTGRLISALPDSATVSAIASSYAESAASSKQDALTFGYNTADQISSIDGSALGGMDEAAVSAIASAYAESAASGKLDKTAQVVSATGTKLYNGTYYLTSVNDNQLSAKYAVSASSATAAFYARYDRQGGVVRYLSSLPGSAEVSAIASAYAESAASSKQDTLTFGYNAEDKISSINGSSLAGEGGGGGLVTAIGTSESGITSINNSGLVDTAALRSADYSSLYVQEPLYISASGDSSYIGISGDVGGVDSATCSAIASAYAESAVSAASSNYYTTANESGFLTAQVQASWSESASASPSYIQDKPDLVDIVAGPGIVIDNPDGNTLRVSTEADAETVLWENYTFADNKASSVAMSETPFNFSQVRITFYIEATSDSWGTLQTQLIDMVALASNTNKNFTLNGTVVYGSQLIVRGSRCNFNGTSITESATVQWYNGGLNNMSNALHIYRIVGIHRIANN